MDEFLLEPLLTTCVLCDTRVEKEEYTILTCMKCGSYVHPNCSAEYPRDYIQKGILMGDRYWNFTCSTCHPQGEVCKRPTIMWVSLLELILFHLLATRPGLTDNSTFWKIKCQYVPIKYFDSRDAMIQLLTEYWPFIMRKETPKQFNSKFNATLTSNLTRYFVRMHDKPSYWALRNPVLPNADPRIQNRVKNFSKTVASHLSDLQSNCIVQTFTSCYSDICPIVDFKYEDAKILELSTNVNLSTADKRLLRKLKVRRFKREKTLPMIDLDMEISMYLNNSFSMEVIKHSNDEEMQTDNNTTRSKQIFKLKNALNPPPAPKTILYQVQVEYPFMNVGKQLSQDSAEHISSPVLHSVDFVSFKTEYLPQIAKFIKTNYSPQTDSIL
eukprot:NODE_149_length_17312_cov_0.399349.p5 type:complete len:384 gc:universal NODE_149_length_17312_cov_0.399349:4027-5178(+)